MAGSNAFRHAMPLPAEQSISRSLALSLSLYLSPTLGVVKLHLSLKALGYIDDYRLEGQDLDIHYDSNVLVDFEGIGRCPVTGVNNACIISSPVTPITQHPDHWMLPHGAFP